MGCVVGVAVGAGCWGGVLGREVGVVSGLPRMPRIKLAPLYHPDTLVNPDTCLGKSMIMPVGIICTFSYQANLTQISKIRI